MWAFRTYDEKSMFLIILERFYCFPPCKCMHKHAFAGRNTQQSGEHLQGVPPISQRSARLTMDELYFCYTVKPNWHKCGVQPQMWIIVGQYHKNIYDNSYSDHYSNHEQKKSDIQTVIGIVKFLNTVLVHHSDSTAYRAKTLIIC